MGMLLGKHWPMYGMWNIEIFECNVQYGVMDNIDFVISAELIGVRCVLTLLPARDCFGKSSVYGCAIRTPQQGKLARI